MRLSPQSAREVRNLLNGDKIQSGAVVLGPLDQTTRILLEILTNDFEALNELSGIDRARDLLTRFKAQRAAEEAAGTADADQKGDTTPVSTEDIDEGEISLRPGWRLVELQALSYRGLAPVGETITFLFEGKSNLIFGPNGSGKSSLLGAVIWVLTNDTVTDADEDNDTADVYEVPEGGGAGQRIRQWPTHATLPDTDLNTLEPSSSVTLKLRSQNGESLVWLRRTDSQPLEQSTNGEEWQPLADLAELGIEALDLQLSLVAPLIFGRRTVEQAEESKDILRLMLGYDDLTRIAKLASDIGRNRTTLETAENKTKAIGLEELKEKLKEVLSEIPVDELIWKDLEALSSEEVPSEDRIREITEATNSEIEAAEQNIATALGLKTTDTEKPEGLADKLTLAVANLEADFATNFPSFSTIQLATVLPKIEGVEPHGRLMQLESSVEHFIEDTRFRIAKRHDWWLEEVAPKSRASLLLTAAEYYDPEAEECPVCDQSVAHLDVKDELTRLKDVDPELRREVKDFFNDLCKEIDEIVPENIKSHGDTLPKERIENDWSALKQGRLDQAFTSLAITFDSNIQKIADRCIVGKPEPVNLLPDEVEEDFKNLGSTLEEKVTRVRGSIEILRWSAAGFNEPEASIVATVTHLDANGDNSLLGILSKGKGAAASVGLWRRVRDALRVAYKMREKITKIEETLADLAELRGPINTLKELSAFAEDAIDAIFGDIIGATNENWKKLYPETPSGLKPAPLVMKSKGVEARLASGDYQVPARFFANSGLQRAIALSFYFALLEKHSGGLGFVIMDDSILSLDDEHRETWSASILRPRMASTQFIFATHQREFLLNCRQDFAGECVVELNPRARNRQLSWRRGNRLDQAERDMDGAYLNAPKEMRNFRDEMMKTLDAYNTQPFFDSRSPNNTLEYYEAITAPNPLAGNRQREIVSKLRDFKVIRVLDPGTHVDTEAQVTVSMVRECLQVLRKCENIFRKELQWLDSLRSPARRARKLVSAVVVHFPEIPTAANWNDPLELKLLGRAAAKPDAVTIDLSESPILVKLKPGSTILVRSDTLDPVAKRGQWVILAAEDVSVADGNLAAVATADGRHLLRRLWSDEDYWRMESINPVHLSKVQSVLKNEAEVRKIHGVLFEPKQTVGTVSDSSVQEWEPFDYNVPDAISALYSITAEGDSLEPIARAGQTVLVSEGKTVRESTMSKGSLGVVETKDSKVGNVIKRVFPGDPEYILVSPNPVEPHDPIRVRVEQIKKLWPLRGILFEAATTE